jgi:hypothetical protein
VSQANPPSYHLDDDTQELVEIVLTWAQELADLQKDDEVQADMQNLLLDLAERFHIQRNTVNIEETEDDNGDIHLKIRVEREPTEPKLSIVEGDKKVVPFKPIDDEDDGTRH